jgi:hypothetical protein
VVVSDADAAGLANAEHQFGAADPNMQRSTEARAPQQPDIVADAQAEGHETLVKLFACVESEDRRALSRAEPIQSGRSRDGVGGHRDPGMRIIRIVPSSPGQEQGRSEHVAVRHGEAFSFVYSNAALRKSLPGNRN